MERKAALVVASIALATDMFVYGLAIPLLPQIAVESGAGSGLVGLLFAVYAAALLLATPLVGWLVDRVGTRTPMLVGLLGLAMATLLFAFVDSLPALLAARALQGAAAAVAWVGGLGLVAAAYPAAERGKPMGIALSATGIGILIGPAAGGLLSEHFGVRVPFLVAAGVAALDGLARLWLVRDVDHEPREVAARVWSHPSMPLLFLLTAVGAGLVAFLEPILPLAAHSEHGATSQTIGLMFTGAVIIGATVAPFSGLLADRVPRGLLAASGAITAAAGLFVVSAADGLVMSAVGLALTVTGGQLVLTPTLVMIGDVADSRRPPAHGAAYAAYSLAYTTGLVIAPLAAGSGSGAFGFRGVTLIGGSIVAVLAIATVALTALLHVPHAKHARSPWGSHASAPVRVSADRSEASVGCKESP